MLRNTVALALASSLLSLAIAGCNSSSATVATAPSPVKCQVQATMGQTTIAAGGGSGSVTVTAAPECAWTASSSVSWITGLAPASGQGSGEVRFQVAANPSPSPRSGQIALNDATVTLAQSAAACQYAIAPASQSLAAGGDKGSVVVTTPTECSWTATSDSQWLSVISGAAGSGNGTVMFVATANTGATRVGTLAIGDKVFTATQMGSCALTINPTSQALAAGGGAGAAIAVNTATGCSWTATTQDSWITIASPASGNGNGTVNFSVAANTGATRAGAIAVGGQTFSVTQAGSCATTISPGSQAIAATGGAGAPIAVTTSAGCAWIATTPDSWIVIANPASGQGNGTVGFTVAANTGPARTGTIVIAGQTHTVNQAANCAAALNPSSQTVPASGGAGVQIDVTVAAGCGWTASTADAWIALTPPASGTGNGAVNFSVAATTGPARTGTITIAGQTHTVTQTSGCTYALDSTGASFSSAASTSAPVNVTTAPGCTWSAVANDSWITVVTGASGTGNGSVTFQVAANTTGSARTGTLTIAGITFTVTQSFPIP